MTALYSVLLFAVAVVIYAWVGYPLFVFAMAMLFSRKRRLVERPDNPFVSIIVPVHNEEQKIASKLRDCIDLLYLHDRFEIIVASDGSTDRTEGIVRRFAAEDPRIHWLSSETRVGK